MIKKKNKNAIIRVSEVTRFLHENLSH